MLPIGFKFLGALEVNQPSGIRHQTLITKQLSKKPTLLAPFYAVFRYLAATQCISVFKYIAIFILATQLAYSYIFYSKFLRLFKIRYSTITLMKELHLCSFKLYQQVLYFNKQYIYIYIYNIIYVYIISQLYFFVTNYLQIGQY